MVATPGPFSSADSSVKRSARNGANSTASFVLSGKALDKQNSNITSLVNASNNPKTQLQRCTHSNDYKNN